MSSLNEENFRSAVHSVNTQGYAAIDLSDELPDELGLDLYRAMDAKTVHPNRSKYYNELAFYWPEDWSDVDKGIGVFHDENSLRRILPSHQAIELMTKNFGVHLAEHVISFANQIRCLTIKSHFGLSNNELRLSRVMVRQMNERDVTNHGGSAWHEDIGYSNRPYQQLLSVILTTYGTPTAAHRYSAKVGELLIFNAFDRRRLLGLSSEFAFIHKGPKSGPKMFFFFEFLGPRYQGS